jgi:hypothetical protein
MTISSRIGMVFLGLAAIFVALALRDRLKNGAELTPARKAWIRVGVIFSAVGLGLYFFHPGR